MSLPLRIAILECDTPLDIVKAKYGSYGTIFTTLLKAGADSLDFPGLSSTTGLEISTFDVVQEQAYPTLEDIDAVLLTGSKFNAHDNDPWILKLVAFTEEILKQRRVRIIGVCFGQQIVGRALGAKVGLSDKGWETSVTAIDLTKKGQELFGKTALAIFQMHRDIVWEYPEGTEELGYTDKCAVQGFYIPKRVIAVQGHPEFNGEIVRHILNARHALGIFNDEQFKDGIERVDRYHDGVVVAAAFLKFLLE